MGGIHYGPGVLHNSMIEMVGFKAGLVLSPDEIEELLDGWALSLWQAADGHGVRVRSEDVDQLLLTLLKAVGNTEDDSPISPAMRLSMAREDPAPRSVRSRVVELHTRWAMEAMMIALKEDQQPDVLDPTPFLNQVLDEVGEVGAEFARRYLRASDETIHRSVWGRVRHVEWSEVIELRALFESESLSAQYGDFIDQRYVDYLQANADALSRMNWRKFEGLTAEFFMKAGYHAEIGPGRADGGIDVRVWPDETDRRAKPPLIVVQCRRTKGTVDQVVVKALWADMIAEGAQSGLIVTTSRMAPGAKTVCTARGYPVRDVDGDKLREWLRMMRTPFAGYQPPTSNAP